MIGSLSQLLSRICHPNPSVRGLLDEMLTTLLLTYPQKTSWSLIALLKSTVKERAARAVEILKKRKGNQNNERNNHLLQQNPSFLSLDFKELLNLSEQLIFMANINVNMTGGNGVIISLSKDVKSLKRLFPLKQDICVPCSALLNNSLPEYLLSKNSPLPMIMSIQDNIIVMPSLQRPKKIVVLCSDGTSRCLLIKPKDDLRKDARFMEFANLGKYSWLYV